MKIANDYSNTGRQLRGFNSSKIVSMTWNAIGRGVRLLATVGVLIERVHSEFTVMADLLPALQTLKVFTDTLM